MLRGSGILLRGWPRLLRRMKLLRRSMLLLDLLMWLLHGVKLLCRRVLLLELLMLLRIWMELLRRLVLRRRPTIGVKVMRRISAVPIVLMRLLRVLRS
jgi:hypothetical protein